MRTPLRLTAASVAAAALVATAAGAEAAPIETAQAPGTPAAISEGTGSSALDAFPNGLQTGSYYLERGDAIGMLALLANLPFAILFGDICQLTTNSAWRPCGGGY